MEGLDCLHRYGKANDRGEVGKFGPIGGPDAAAVYVRYLSELL
jgi:hypothetical protein